MTDALQIGNLPTLNQDPYPSLGEWWLQIWQGDKVFARVYGSSPEQVRENAEQIINWNTRANAESCKPDTRDELEELAKIEQQCLKMLPMFTEEKDAEIRALKETIATLSKKDEQIRILREGLRNGVAMAELLGNESIGSILSIALAAADKLNGE